MNSVAWVHRMAPWPKLKSCDRLMLVVIVIAALAGYLLAWQKYRLFNGDTNDLAIFSFAFAGAVRGECLPLYYMDGSLLGNHLNFVILIWLPMFAIWKSFFSLLFYQSVVIALGAWPLYLLSKQVLKQDYAALMIGCSYLLFPTIVSQHVNQIHDDQFALPFLLFAFYFFFREDFWKFTTCMVVACLAKETITFTTAAIGIYGLVQGRRLRWVLTPLLFSVGYFLVSIEVMGTFFAGVGAGLYTGTTYLDVYGQSPGEVLKTFISRPQFVLNQMFSPSKLEFLRTLFTPLVGVLPLLSWVIIISLPNLLLNLIASNPAMSVIPWHYNLILGATLVMASVFGIRALCDWFPQHAERLTTWLPLAMLFGVIYSLSLWFSIEDYRERPQAAALRKAVAMIPQDASVMCPTPLLAHLSSRPKVNSAYSIYVAHKTPEALFDFEYIILDGNWRSYEALGQQPLIQALQTSQRYELKFRENNVLVLRRM